jgi:dihydroneopterin aldolase
LRIYLESFKFKTIVGILDFEREREQSVEVDLVVDYSYSDGEFIDYVELRDLISTTMRKEKFGLLEDAVNQLTNLIVSKYTIEYLKLKISKPDILDDALVSLEVEWRGV